MINDVTGFSWRKAQNLLKKQGVQNIIIANSGKMTNAKNVVVLSSTYSADGKSAELTLGAVDKK